MSELHFTVSPAQLGELAGLIPGEKSPLSPLNIPNPPGLDPDQRAELVKAGLMDESGLVEPARLMLAALSEAPAFARLRLSSQGGYLDEAIHFTDETSQTVRISNTPDGLEVSSPGDAEAILAQVREFTGSFDQPSPGWSLELPTLEALCLAALLDLRRQAVLRAIANQQPVFPPAGDDPAVVAAIQSMWGNSQWLTTAVQNTAVLTSQPPPSQVQAALVSLASRQQLLLQGGSYFPRQDAIAVVDRFPLIGTILTLDAGNSNLQGAFTLTRQSWLQSSSTEMLHLARNGDQILLETITPGEALGKIQFYLTHHDAVAAPPLAQVDLALFLQSGSDAGQVYPLGEETVLGRSDLVQVRIPDTRASRRHAVVRKLSQGYQLSDAGSTNGTYLNGQFLTTATWLHEGDLITIGETQIKVILASAPARTARPPERVEPPGAQPPAVEPASESLPAFAPVSTTPSGAQTEPPSDAVEADSPAETPQEAEVPPVPPAAEPGAEESEPLLSVEEGESPPHPAETEAPIVESLSSPPAAEINPAETSATETGPADPEIPAAGTVCPNCGASTNPEARFCGACGFHLEA